MTRRDEGRQTSAVTPAPPAGGEPAGARAMGSLAAMAWIRALASEWEDERARRDDPQEPSGLSLA